PLFAPDCPESALASHGTLAAGGLVTTISSPSTVQDATYQLRDARARFLVTVPSFMDRAAPVAQQVGIEEIFVLGSAPGATPFATLLETAAPAPRAPVDPARDLAVLPYSSGTTGFPKGVVLTHRNRVANLLQTASVHHVADQDRTISVLPFCHSFGLQVEFTLALGRGG